MPVDRLGDVSIRPAEPADHLAVRRVIDAALLEVGDLEARIEAGEVLVATDGDPVVGAAVVDAEGPPGPDGAEPAPLPPRWRDAAHLRAVAVRRRRRGEGVGTALVEAATRSFGPLVADCVPDVVEFYRELGATIRAAEDRRWALVEASGTR